MSRWIKVLLIIAMLMPSVNMARASGDGGGGNVVDIVNTAFSQPARFVTVVYQLVIIATIFSVVLPPVRSKKPVPISNSIAIALSAGVNPAVVFLALMVNSAVRYQTYALISILPFLLNKNMMESEIASEGKAETEGLWNVSNPEQMPAQVAPEDTAEAEKQELIEKAVARALENPDYVKNYLQYTSSEVQEAVKKALNDRAYEQMKQALKNVPGHGNFSAPSN
jgi:hypothetical protein